MPKHFKFQSLRIVSFILSKIVEWTHGILIQCFGGCVVNKLAIRSDLKVLIWYLGHKLVSIKEKNSNTSMLALKREFEHFPIT